MFNTKIPIYGIMILLSVIANIIILLKILKKTDNTSEENIGLILFENMGIINGAIILHNFQNGNFNLFKKIYLGLSSYGALIGAIIMLILFVIIFKKNILELSKYLFIPIPLMYSIGKIGCFIAGCCHGIEYNGRLSVVYNYSDVAEVGIHYFPIQLLESIVFLIIFLVIIYLLKKNNKNIISIELILCTIAKFSLEFLRSSHVGIVLSSTQIISIIFFIIGIILLFIKKPLKKWNAPICVDIN